MAQTENISLPIVPVKCIEKKDDQQHHKSAWFQFIKSMTTFKGDLASLTAPPFLLAPQSIVEFSTYWAEYPSIFVAPAQEPDAETRALKVLQWFLTTLRRQHATKDDSGKKRKLKPLNAFLGEIFLGKWVDAAGVTEMVSEQVSHHPPATAFMIRNESHGVKLEGHIAPRAYFSTTVNIERKGYGLLHIDKYNEDHLFTMPKVHVEGLVTLQLAPELSGTSYIRSSSGFTSRVDYSCKGWVRGKSNSFVARLYRDDSEKNPLYILEGQWSGSYTVKNGKGEILDAVNLAALTPTPLEVEPIDKQHPLESRRAWQHVIDGIHANDIMVVGREKSKIENGQRALRKEEKAAGCSWERRYFSETTADPVIEELGLSADYDWIWKFDDQKYQRTIQNNTDGVKSSTHARFDSGIGFVDELEPV